MKRAIALTVSLLFSSLLYAQSFRIIARGGVQNLSSGGSSFTYPGGSLGFYYEINEAMRVGIDADLFSKSYREYLRLEQFKGYTSWGYPEYRVAYVERKARETWIPLHAVFMADIARSSRIEFSGGLGAGILRASYNEPSTVFTWNDGTLGYLPEYRYSETYFSLSSHAVLSVFLTERFGLGADLRSRFVFASSEVVVGIGAVGGVIVRLGQ